MLDETWNAWIFKADGIDVTTSDFDDTLAIVSRLWFKGQAFAADTTKFFNIKETSIVLGKTKGSAGCDNRVLEFNTCNGYRQINFCIL